jgi:hypothetical protein
MAERCTDRTDRTDVPLLSPTLCERSRVHAHARVEALEKSVLSVPTGDSTPKVACTGCGSTAVVNRGGATRQCAVCRWRFEFIPTGETTSIFSRWLQSQRRFARRRGKECK